MARTKNGARTNLSSGDACLDLFSMIGSARSAEGGVLKLFSKAFQVNPGLALKILLWSRDARGGAGERKTFRHLLHWLDRVRPDVSAVILKSGVVEQLGRWDDYFSVGRQESFDIVVERVRQALLQDDRLAAKWLPRSGPIAVRLAKGLGLSKAEFRKLLVLNSDTVEKTLCQGGDITYRQVPSVALARYHRTFRKRNPMAYEQFLSDVAAGKETMNTSVVFPHDITRSANIDNIAATAQWSQLASLEYALSALVLCDVSGSMTQRISGNLSAMDVCVAMGLYLSERLPAPFTNQVITFTSTPHWHEVKGVTLLERMHNLMSAAWGMNTNIQAAFDLVLQRAKSAEPGFVMPKALVVLSDMEFDSAGKRPNHDQMKRKFEAAGIEMPTLVYWNLKGRPGNLPARDVPGVINLSGYSPAMMTKVLAGDLQQVSAREMMLEIVDVPRYTVPGLPV